MISYWLCDSDKISETDRYQNIDRVCVSECMSHDHERTTSMMANQDVDSNNTGDPGSQEAECKGVNINIAGDSLQKLKHYVSDHSNVTPEERADYSHQSPEKDFSEHFVGFDHHRHNISHSCVTSARACSPINGPTVDVLSTGADAHNSADPPDSPGYPGWVRKIVQRQSGHTVGRYDVYFYSPSGRKFRSKNDLLKYFHENNLDLDISRFDFSKRSLNGPITAADTNRSVSRTINFEEKQSHRTPENRQMKRIHSEECYSTKKRLNTNSPTSYSKLVVKMNFSTPKSKQNILLPLTDSENEISVINREILSAEDEDIIKNEIEVYSGDDDEEERSENKWRRSLEGNNNDENLSSESSDIKRPNLEGDTLDFNRNNVRYKTEGYSVLLDHFDWFPHHVTFDQPLNLSCKSIIV